MVAFNESRIVAVPIKEAIAKYHYVDLDSDLIGTARGVGINLGD
jgi:hypothetical protein